MTTPPSTAGELAQTRHIRLSESGPTVGHMLPGSCWPHWVSGAFAVLTYVVDTHTPLAFDQPLLDLARSWGQWTFEWKLLSESANIPLVVIGIGMVIWLFVTKRRREALVVLLVLIAVTAGSEGIKQLVARPRPSGPTRTSRASCTASPPVTCSRR